MSELGAGAAGDGDAGFSLVLCAMFASALVGMVGLLPMAILPCIPKHLHASLVRSLLAAACGGLLANAWLHLMPEAMELQASMPHTRFHHLLGPLSSLAGILVLFILEKASLLLERSGAEHGRVTGYLTIFVNMLDNIAHGMSVSAAFAISPKVGTVTTLAILMHEIPHEISDYAILVNAGLTVRQAIAGQITTSCGGMLGAVLGVSMTSPEVSLGLLSFTAGGFCYIAMVSLIPTINAACSLRQTLLDLVLLLAGIASIALVAIE